MRVVCASVSAIRGSVFAEMQSIREAALRHNVPLGVHAALFYQDGWFLFWVEGPRDTAPGLIEHIRQDPRHHSLRILHHSRGPRYLVSPWSMGISQYAQPHEALGARVERLRRDLEQGVAHTPVSVMRRLAMPMLHPRARALPDPDAYVRLGVTSAGASEAFTLVNWLGAHHQQPVFHWRVAGEGDHDSANDYVEVFEDDLPLRVIAVARQGLMHSMRRAVLPDWPLYLLLFCGDGFYDNALMQRMAQACAGLPAAPLLLGVSPTAATHDRMFRMAAASGLGYRAAGVARPDDCLSIWRLVRPFLADDHLDSVGGIDDSSMVA